MSVAHEFNENFKILIFKERKITNEVLLAIRRSEKERLHLKLGYSSTYDWLIKGHGFTSSSAHRRIKASRLIRDVPSVVEKLETGRVNLTTMAQLETLCSLEERRAKVKFTPTAKAQLVERLQDQTSKQVEKILATEFPQARPNESLRLINETESKLTLIIDEETSNLLQEAKSLMSHSTTSTGEVLKRALKTLIAEKSKSRLLTSKTLAQKSKTNKGTDGRTNKGTDERTNEGTDERKNEMKSTLNTKSQGLKSVNKLESSTVTQQAAVAAVKARNLSGKIPIQVRRQVFERAKNSCEFIDFLTKKKCGSKFQLEIDHIQPQAIGGTHDHENLRCLCRSHNLLAAQMTFGSQHMERYWPS